jgi:predicted negative regulator of RcsB-dependent stress response
MAVYDLQEREQIDDLKAWWTQWSGSISTALLIAALIVAGVQGYRWWSGKRAEEASVLYSAVSEAVRKDDDTKAKDAMAQLADRYASSSYAPRAALLYAKLLHDKNDIAGSKAQLSWAVDHSDDDALKAIARYRLAQTQLDEKQYDEALKTLDAKHPDAFDGLYADLRGDALSAAGRAQEARAAYQSALARIDPKSQYRTFLQVKLDALGGPEASSAPAKTAGSDASTTTGKAAPVQANAAPGKSPAMNSSAAAGKSPPSQASAAPAKSTGAPAKP